MRPLGMLILVLLPSRGFVQSRSAVATTRASGFGPGRSEAGLSQSTFLERASVICMLRPFLLTVTERWENAMLRIIPTLCFLQVAALWIGCGDSGTGGGVGTGEETTGGETTGEETTGEDATGQETTGDDASGECEGFLQSFITTVSAAKACETASDCSSQVSDTMYCGCGSWVSSDAVAEELAAIRESSEEAGCLIPACPAVECEPLAPAVCKAGRCWPQGKDPVCWGLQEEITQASISGGICENDADCSVWVDGGLGCNCGDFVTSTESATQLSGLLSDYSNEGCHALTCGVCPPPNYVASCQSGLCAKELVSCSGIVAEFGKALQAAKACTDASDCEVVDNLGLDCACPQYLAVEASITEAQSLANDYQKAGCALPCDVDCATLGAAACLDGECRSEP